MNISPPPPALTLLPVTAHEIQCHCRLYCSQTPKSHMKSFLEGHSLLQTQFDSYNFLWSIYMWQLSRYDQLCVLHFLFKLKLHFYCGSQFLKKERNSICAQNTFSAELQFCFGRDSGSKFIWQKQTRGLKSAPSDPLLWFKQISSPLCPALNLTPTSAMAYSVCWSSNFGQFQQNRIAI